MDWQLFQAELPMRLINAGLVLGAIWWCYHFCTATPFLGHRSVLKLRSYRWPNYIFYAGSQRQYLKFFCGPATSVYLAAVKLPNDIIYAVERPGRHHHLLQMLVEQDVNRKILQKAEQGFITEHGLFVNRIKAAEIANKNKVTPRLRVSSSPDVLYSEDLFETPEGWCNAAVEVPPEIAPWSHDAIRYAMVQHALPKTEEGVISEIQKG